MDASSQPVTLPQPVRRRSARIANAKRTRNSLSLQQILDVAHPAPLGSSNTSCAKRTQNLLSLQQPTWLCHPESVLDRVAAGIRHHAMLAPGERAGVAVSGGADSV